MQKPQNFDDYRDFIQFRFNELKKTKKYFSYQVAATDLKTTRSYLKLVGDKKRHISIEKVEALSRYFNLNDEEKQYFLFLFLKNTAKGPELKEFFATVLGSYVAYQRFPNTEAKLTENFTNQNSHFGNWVNLAILGLATFPGYQHEVVWIQKKLGGKNMASTETIKKSLAELEKDGSMIKTKKGWALQVADFIAPTKPFDIQSNQIYRVGLARADLALAEFGKSPLHRPSRHHMYCLELSNADGAELMKMYDDFQERLIEFLKKAKNPERLFFISNNAFAISE